MVSYLMHLQSRCKYALCLVIRAYTWNLKLYPCTHGLMPLEQGLYIMFMITFALSRGQSLGVGGIPKNVN
jgi:hypothetical protein